VFFTPPLQGVLHAAAGMTPNCRTGWDLQIIPTWLRPRKRHPFTGGCLNKQIRFSYTFRIRINSKTGLGGTFTIYVVICLSKVVLLLGLPASTTFSFFKK